MGAPLWSHRTLARIIVLAGCILVTAMLASPAAAQRFTRHVTHGLGRGIDADEFSMSWRTSSFTPFSHPRSAPGQRTPSIDGDLIACTTGRPASAPTAAGLDIRFHTLGGAAGVWGGPGDQQQPSVAGGLIAGLDRGRVAVFDPATGCETVVSDAEAAPSAPAFSGDVVVWPDRRGGAWDIYGRRYDRATGEPAGDAFVICTAPGDQTRPAVDGGVVVWQDRRSGSWDVYARDLATMTERPVCTAAGDQVKPRVCGQTVVWQDGRSGQWHIYQCDLATDTESPVGLGWGRQTTPDISSDLIVYDSSDRLGAPANDRHARRYTSPKVIAYSRAAGEELWAMGDGDPFGPTRQAHAAVNGATAVWEQRSPRAPIGTTRVVGAQIHDLWVYNWKTVPETGYVNVPELTFELDWWVCPAPPVTEVGIGVTDRDFVFGHLVWQPFAHQVTISLTGGDGNKNYGISFKDSAGGTFGTEGSSVILDTHGPVCRALAPVTVQSGGTALVSYKVTDKLSEMARVGVAVLRTDGTLVENLRPRWVDTGVQLTRRIDCDLMRGSYLLQITATDQAGNPQVRAGTTTLTVK